MRRLVFLRNVLSIKCKKVNSSTTLNSTINIQSLVYTLVYLAVFSCQSQREYEEYLGLFFHKWYLYYENNPQWFGHNMASTPFVCVIFTKLSHLSLLLILNFCWATDCPYFGLCVTPPWVLKPGWFSCLHSLFVCVWWTQGSHLVLHLPFSLIEMYTV